MLGESFLNLIERNEKNAKIIILFLIDLSKMGFGRASTATDSTTDNTLPDGSKIPKPEESSRKLEEITLPYAVYFQFCFILLPQNLARPNPQPQRKIITSIPPPIQFNNK
jgi:hypothetical protein